MRKLSNSFVLGFLLALLFLAQLRAQTVTRVPTAANTTPTGQAPDEVMKTLSDLVHAGKYAEAQQLTTGLLLAYPDDQRLIKAKALLDKSLAAASANATTRADPAPGNVASAQPAASATTTQLTG